VRIAGSTLSEQVATSGAHASGGIPRPAGDAATRARRLTLLATIIGSSMTFVDGTVVNIALPAVARDLDLGLAGQQWVVLGYSLAVASLYLVAGSLGDRLGRRRLFIAGTAGFAIASALCGVAPSGAMLVAARILQGVAGAFLTTNSLALLRSTFGTESGRAVGTWTAWTGIGTVGGPPLGGLLVEYLSWRWIFFINLPLAVATVLLAGAGRTDQPEPKMGARLNVPAAAATAVAFAAMTYALVEGARSGFATVIWAFAVAAVALAAFVVSERRSSAPLVPTELLRERLFVVANTCTFLVYAALGGAFFFLALYLQSPAVGFSPTQASLLFVPVSLVMLAFAARVGRAADRSGPRRFLAAGPSVMALGLLLVGAVSRPGAGVVLVAMLVFSAGLALTVAPITSTALVAVPGRLAGLAAGVNTTVSRFGSLVAIPLMGIAITQVFEARAPGRGSDAFAAPAAMQPAVLDAFRAGMGLAAALCVGGALLALWGIDDREARAAAAGEPAPPPQTLLDGPPAHARAVGCGR
jgi:EmrB/QacA subfamily drug resistance transporter